MPAHPACGTANGVSMHLPGSAALGIRSQGAGRARLLRELLRRQHVELIRELVVYLLSLRQAGRQCHRAVPPPCPSVPPGLTPASRCARTHLSRSRMRDMSVCSRVQASSHWVSPSTRAWHSSHRNLSVFSARCKTLLRSARAKRGVGGSLGAHSEPPSIPPELQSCCPPTRTFRVLFLLAFSPLRSLHLSPYVIPCKGQSPGKGEHHFWGSPMHHSISCPPTSALKTRVGPKEAAQLVPNPIVATRESPHTLGAPCQGTQRAPGRAVSPPDTPSPILGCHTHLQSSQCWVALAAQAAPAAAALSWCWSPRPGRRAGEGQRPSAP